MRPTLTTLIIILALTGCGDDAMLVDAGTDADTSVPPPDTGPMEIIPDPPAPAALPDLGCPDGWTTLDVAGTTVCEPWSLEDGPGCTADEFRFPGDAACAPLGPDCPADGVPTDLPAGPVLHVRAGSAMGDGTLGAPLSTINDALAIAAAGDVIAVHTGTYPEALDLTMSGGISVVGACAAQTILDAPMGASNTAGVLMTGDTLFERMTVLGERPGVRAEGPGVATIRHVIIEARQWGIVMTGMGSLVAESIVVRNIAPGGEFGYGLFLNEASTLELRRGYFEDLQGFGLALSGDGSSALVEDTAIRNVTETEDGMLGNGIAMQTSIPVTLRRVVIEHAWASGVFVQQGAEATMEDVLIRDVLGTDGETGFGVAVNSRATIDLSRVRIERATTGGVTGVGFGSVLRARDLVIHEIRSRTSDGTAGAGLFFDTGLVGEVDRMLVHRARGAGVALVGVDIDAVFRDTTYDEILAEEAGRVVGTGIDLHLAARATFERVHVRSSNGAGLISSDPDTLLTATDVRVDGMPPPMTTGFTGRGANIQLGGGFDCTRCVFRECAEVGVFLHGEGGFSTLRELVVENTMVGDTSGAAMGVVAVLGAIGDVERFVIHRNAVAGLQMASGGNLNIRDGVVAEHPIGVNVQDATADPANLTDRVVYRDNERNLDSSGLPVPAAGPI